MSPATNGSGETIPVTPPQGTSSLTGAIVIRLRERARLRNIELALLIPAFAIMIGAMVNVQLAVLGTTDDTVLWSLGFICLLVLVLHLVLRLTAKNADPILLPVAVALNGIGIAMIARIDFAEDTTGWDSTGMRQIAWTAIAVILAIATLIVIRSHRVLQRYRFIAMFVGIALLLLPLVPGIGATINGARLWVNLGFVQFQPGELAKVALAIFFAGYLVSARDSLTMVGPKILGVRLPRARDLGPILVVFAASMAVLVLQRDLGTALLYFGLFLVMMYTATGQPAWVVLGLGLFVAGALVASQALDYVNWRFVAWLDAFNQDVYDAPGGSWQLVQGLFGLSAGGMFGTGLGQGRPEITELAQSDFIVTALGEELGLVGLFAILALYLVFVSRGIRIGFTGTDDFGRLLSVGLAFVIALQVFIVIGGVTRVIPLTGLTTPFLAAGGSSLVANWIIVALLLRISDTVRARPIELITPAPLPAREGVRS